MWKLLAFLAKYGHQQVEATRKMSMRDLRMFSRGITEIMREEAEAIERAKHKP